MTTSNLSPDVIKDPLGAPWPVAKNHWWKDRSLNEGTVSCTAELQGVQPGHLQRAGYRRRRAGRTAWHRRGSQRGTPGPTQKQETRGQREVCTRNSAASTHVYAYAHVHAAHTLRTHPVAHMHARPTGRKACSQTNTFLRAERAVLQQNRGETPPPPPSWDETQVAASEPCRLPPKPARGSVSLTCPEQRAGALEETLRQKHKDWDNEKKRM